MRRLKGKRRRVEGRKDTKRGEWMDGGQWETGRSRIRNILLYRFISYIIRI